MGLLSKHLTKTSTPSAATTAPTQAPQQNQGAAGAAEPVAKTVEATVVKTEPTSPKATGSLLGKRTAPTPATETPKETPKAPKAEETTPAVETRAVAAYDPFAVITGNGAADIDSVLGFVMAQAEQGAPSFEGPFPLLKLSKGNSGGKWVCGSNVDDLAKTVMPVADNAFVAQFIGYSIYGLAWPEGYKSRDDKNAPGDDTDKTKPLWKVEIPNSAVKEVQLAMTAGEKYQFDGSKSKYDGLGHFRPGVRFHFFTVSKLTGDPVVFTMQLPDHFTSSQRALTSLGAVMKGLGGMRSAPLRVEPYTTQEPGKVQWSCHSVHFSVAVDAEGLAVQKAFNEIKAALLADEEFAEKFKEANKYDVSEQALASLEKIASMGR